MIDLLVNGVLTALAVLVGLLALQRWRKKKSLWFIFSMVAALLAALIFWTNWTDGFLLLLLAGILLFAGIRLKKA